MVPGRLLGRDPGLIPGPIPGLIPGWVLDLIPNAIAYQFALLCAYLINY